MESIKRCISRITAWLLIFLLCLTDPVSVSASNVGGSLSVGIQSTKTLVFRPLEPKERDILSVYDLVYEGLLYIDDDYLPQGKLAQSWEMSSNGKVWTFHLRHDVTFSDGTPLTAADVVASAQYILDRAKDETTEDHGFYSNLAYFVTSISASDDYTVVVKSNKRRCFGLLYEMTFPVVPAAYVASDNPPGTGPYTVDFSKFQPGSYIYLNANPNWWQAQPVTREITFVLHDTQKAVVDSYEYARVNTIFTRSIAGAQYKSGTSALAMSFRTNQLECLLMNNRSSELTKEVRLAIRYVVDVDKIISNVYSGLAVKTNLPFFPGTWMYNDGLGSYFEQDIDKARQLLEEAGWSDSDDDGILDRMNADGKLVKLHLRFYVYEEPENDVRHEAANIIADQLAAVGISVTVEAMTMSNVHEKLSAGSFDLALVSFAMDVCPDPGFMLMRGNTGNYTRYVSERMTELFEELRTQTTQTGYRDTLMKIQALFAEDCPFLCLYYRMGTVLTRYMYTTVRDVREYELLRGIEKFNP